MYELSEYKADQQFTVVKLTHTERNHSCCNIGLAIKINTSVNTDEIAKSLNFLENKAEHSTVVYEFLTDLCKSGKWFFCSTFNDGISVIVTRWYLMYYCHRTESCELKRKDEFYSDKFCGTWEQHSPKSVIATSVDFELDKVRLIKNLYGI